MKTLARAIVTGFGLSIGSFIYRKIAKKLGLEDPQQPKREPDLNARDAATDPGLQHPHHRPQPS